METHYRIILPESPIRKTNVYLSINSGRPDKRPPGLPPHTDRHTHSGFRHAGWYCHYTSGISGRSQVYALPVDEIVTTA